MLLQICTIGVLTSLCRGDLGGPSIVRLGDSWVLVGVTSAVLDASSGKSVYGLPFFCYTEMKEGANKIHFIRPLNRT